MGEAQLLVIEESGDSAELKRCFAQYYAELGQRFEGGFDPGSAAYAAAPEGVETEDYCVLARIDGYAVGCGMLRSLGGGVAEVKRVWTAPGARGKGIAKAIMDRLESLAVSRGFSAIRLDTNRALTEAVAFYLRRGYRPIDRYNNNPYADHWFEKPVVGA